MTVDIAQGGILRSTKTWKNVGELSGEKGVMVWLGSGVFEDDTWIGSEYKTLYPGIPIEPGEQIETILDLNIPIDAPLGLYNALVGVGHTELIENVWWFVYEISETVIDAVEVIAPVLGVIPVEVSVVFEAV